MPIDTCSHEAADVRISSSIGLFLSVRTGPSRKGWAVYIIFSVVFSRDLENVGQKKREARNLVCSEQAKPKSLLPVKKLEILEDGRWRQDT